MKHLTLRLVSRTDATNMIEIINMLQFEPPKNEEEFCELLKKFKELVYQSTLSYTNLIIFFFFFPRIRKKAK